MQDREKIILLIQQAKVSIELARQIAGETGIRFEITLSDIEDGGENLEDAWHASSQYC